MSSSDHGDYDDQRPNSLPDWGNMMAMVCDDGIVIGSLKQFLLECTEEGIEKNITPKQDSEAEKFVETGNSPQVVLCGVGGQYILSPLINKIVEKVVEADDKHISRPSIEALSKVALNHANNFLYNATFHLFVAGAERDFFGNLQLALRYVNRFDSIKVPKLYVVGSRADLVRHQIAPFKHNTTDQAIELVKFGLASVARKEKDLNAGSISIRVIKTDGTIIKHTLHDLDLIVEAYFKDAIPSDEGASDDDEYGSDDA